MFDPQFIYYDELEEFLVKHYIPQIKSYKIQFAISDELFTRLILDGTELFAYSFYNEKPTTRVKGPRARHRYGADVLDYWNYLFETEFWIELGETVAKELDWPNDFAADWANYMNIWTFKLIRPEASPIFQTYFKREEEDDESDSQPRKEVDPYVADHFSEL